MSKLLVKRNFYLLNAAFAMATLDLLHSFISPKRKSESQYSFPPLGRFTPWEDPRDPLTKTQRRSGRSGKEQGTRPRQESSTNNTHSRAFHFAAWSLCRD